MLKKIMLFIFLKLHELIFWPLGGSVTCFKHNTNILYSRQIVSQPADVEQHQLSFGVVFLSDECKSNIILLRALFLVYTRSDSDCSC